MKSLPGEPETPEGRSSRPRKSARTSSRRPSRSGPVLLPNLSSHAYEHPADRAARIALRRVPGFDLVVRKLFGTLSDRSLRLAFLASSVRVSRQQFPEVYDRYRAAARILDVKPVPELFIAQTPFVNAGAMGIDSPFIVLNSAALDLFAPDELQFLLGHELGHVLSGHGLYKTMLRLLVRLSVVAFSIPLGGAALFGIRAALLEWDRKSELSADRAGLLAVQDPKVARRVQMKMAGGGRTDEMSLDEFEKQAAEYEGGGSVVDSVVKLMQLTGQSHPFPVLRLAELNRWIASDAYDRILDGEYPRRQDDHETSVAEELKATAKDYQQQWSSSEDPLPRLVIDLAKDLQAAGGSLVDRWKQRMGKGDKE